MFYDLDRSIVVFGTYDEDLHLLMEQIVKPGWVCLDVGANIGEVALHMGKLAGPAGAVHAFEPVPALYERLRAHVEKNRANEIVRTHALALANANGKCTLACATADGENQGLASLVNTASGDVPLRIEVPTMRLDDFAAREQLKRVDLVKVDIQGAEMLFLDGARETLARFSPALLMEVSPDDLKCAGTDSRELCAKLAELDYKLFAVKRGRVGEELDPKTMRADFHATNIYCVKQA